ncbi:MAG: winged helix-turn-helix domain-containing protein [Candidatus Bathyarchaeia archaeon]
MECLAARHMTDPKLQSFTEAILQRINFKAPQDKMGTRVKVLLGLYLATLEKRGVTLRELRAYIDKDLSTIWRHIAEFEEVGIAVQVKRGKWMLTSPTLTATLANALDRAINEFNIALAYAKTIDEKFGQAVKETLPIWVKLWIKPLAFTTITTDEEKPITSPNQAPNTKTSPIKARITNKSISENERYLFGCIAELYLKAFFEERAVFLVFYFVYDYSFVLFSQFLSLNGAFS